MDPSDSYSAIWENCLTLLELSGSRETSRLLKGAQLRHYSPENKTFAIEVADARSADWLADRAKPLLTRYLCGLTNDWDVTLIFIPAAEQPVVEPVGQAPAAETPGADEQQLALMRRSIRDIVLQPERVISIPKYLLRWLPYASPSAVLLWIALNQIHYLKSAGKHAAPQRGLAIATSHDEMARWSGLSPVTVKRLFKDPAALAWFLQRGPNRYTTRPGGQVCPQLNLNLLPLGLTPGDASDLAGWLKAHDVDEDPEGCLKQALKTQPRDMLAYPFRLPQATDGDDMSAPRSVPELVGGLVQGALTPAVRQLAESLSAHLGLSGSGDRFITVPWYFMQKSVPLLGDSLAVFTLFCRSLVFHHAASGVSRSDFWLKGGPDSIAALAGVKRERVLDWFKPSRQSGAVLTEKSAAELHNRAQKHALLERFITRQESRKAPDAGLDWRMQACSHEAETPADALAMQLAEKIISAVHPSGKWDELQAWAQKWSGCFDPHAGQAVVDLILTSLPAGCFDPVTQTLSGCFDPHGDLHSGCFETLLKILSEFKDTLLIENPPARPDTAGLTNAAAETFTDSAGGWNINRLAELVKSREKRQMLLQSASTRPFLSQLLAAAGDEAVDKPVNFALVLLAENPGGAAGSCSRLAELPPQRLFELIQASLARQNDELDGDWKSVFAGKPARVRLLAHLLGMGSNAYS